MELHEDVDLEYDGTVHQYDKDLESLVLDEDVDDDDELAVLEDDVNDEGVTPQVSRVVSGGIEVSRPRRRWGWGVP